MNVYVDCEKLTSMEITREELLEQTERVVDSISEGNCDI